MSIVDARVNDFQLHSLFGNLTIYTESLQSAKYFQIRCHIPHNKQHFSAGILSHSHRLTYDLFMWVANIH